ncbi:glycoside hydrolase [Achlya hypogyna]|uniref:glucan endo-1,3-beta-D-glucosidase n=1 Tax=Achlya hypogyna TaxID=1202772 RepID=A0A0A7CMT2_ACHHY|nr:secreted protein [Achlya hypogyna]OQR97977.1 glycoside hydrolase [Achlya hypogyna]
MALLTFGFVMRLLLLTLLAVFVADVAASLGVSYDTYEANKIDYHFRTIKQRFNSVRTYQTYLWNPTRNVIDAAADNGLTIYPGIWLRDGMDYNQEVQAVIDGCKRHPNTVKAVFVGNEDLANGWDQWRVLQKVNDVRGRLRAAGINVPVGSVQIDGDWLQARDLANGCDILGVNIYAFFGAAPVSWQNPIEDLKYRWNQMVQKFPGKTVMLTETGWPHGGGNNGAHISNPGNAIDYFFKVQSWANAGNGGPDPMYFMYHDNRKKGGYEGHFGLANPDGVWKFDFGPPPPDNNPRLKVPFQLLTARGKALRENYQGVAAKDNNHDRFTAWMYDSNTQQLYNVGAGTCLDAYQENGVHKVHMYACDKDNGNQKWRMTKDKIVHSVINNLCLDADPTDASEGVQVWTCVDNNTNQQFTVNSEMQHVSLTARSFNRVFAVGDNDQVLFRASAGGTDTGALWTLDTSKGSVTSESNHRCLDSWEGKNGAVVHAWDCDANNGNQKWNYDTITKQLRHATHQGYCLDMGSDTGDKPYLWQCHDVSDTWVKFQQFQYDV